MSSFLPPMRHNFSSAPSYSTALATVQVKPLGKAPPPIVAPRLQPLKKRKRKHTTATKEEQTVAVVEKAEEPVQRLRRPDSPAFSEIDYSVGVDGEEEESDVPQTHIANEVESPEIMKRLERTMPIWEPWPSSSKVSHLGWMPELEGDALYTRLEIVITRVREYLGPDGLRASIALEQCAPRPDFYSTYRQNLTWAMITQKVQTKQYTNCRQFETDLFRMFEKARRVYEAGKQTYGWILICQRIAQLMTSPHIHDPASAPTTYSSAPGPLRARLTRIMADGVMVDNPQGQISYVIMDRGRNPIPSFIYKGVEYKIGDFVHLFNADDIARPMIGQIWACWNLNGIDNFTVCWYFRPEQTSHGWDHPFYENEVVKTGLYIDYYPEDIAEKVAVQFYPHYFTGRPRAPAWYPGWPIYMCEQRYDERSRSFHHITNPENCFPPQLRPSPAQVSARSLGNSIMQPSLFKNIKLDIIQPLFSFERLVFPIRKSGPNAGPRLPASNGPASFTIGSDTKERMDSPAPGGLDARGRPKRQAAVKAAGAVVGTSAPATSGTGSTPSVSVNTAAAGDRTILSAAGGGMITSASVDKLPPETTKLFDRDPVTNEMLWFSGPPVDVARPPQLRYSLDYLYQLALKKKEASEDGPPASKKAKLIVAPSASEVWYEVSQPRETTA